jgi:hypothetical protein
VAAVARIEDAPMPDTPTLHSRRITRQMDHFILALKTDPATDRPSFLLSLYWLGYELAGGPGHLAYLFADPAGTLPRIELVLTDDLALAEALRVGTRPAQWPLQDPDRPGPTGEVRERRRFGRSGSPGRFTRPGPGAEPPSRSRRAGKEIAPLVFRERPAARGNQIASTLAVPRRATARVNGLWTSRALLSRTRSGIPWFARTDYRLLRGRLGEL